MPASWQHDDSPPKPHLHPVTAPNGRVLTRSVTPDHPWQRGLWFAVKFVDGENFWEELGDHGTQRRADDGAIEWVRPSGEVAIVETRTVSTVDDTTFDWTTVLRAVDDVELDRTPYQGWGGYGGFSLRGAADWSDTRIAIEDDEGPEVIGVASRWCDLSGPDAGITIHDHPSNPRHPVPWYGNVANALYLTDEPTNFVNAAFLFHEPMTLPAGEPLTFRYRVRLHAGLGDWSATHAHESWEAFARD